MKRIKSPLKTLMSLLTIFSLSSCSSNSYSDSINSTTTEEIVDTIPPVINSIKVPEKIYVGQTIKVDVDCTDNVTKQENLRIKYRISFSTSLAKETNGVFKVEEEGLYEVEVTVYDESDNYSFDKITFTSIDPTSYWKSSEKELFNNYFSEVMPYPEGLDRNSYSLSEYTMSKGNKALLLDATIDEDLSESYGEFLTNFGFSLYNKVDVTAKDEITTYTIFNYIKHQSFETNDDNFLVVHVDYFPGYDESYTEDSALPTFEVFYYYQSFQVDIYTSDKWETSLVKTALDKVDIASEIPAFTCQNENASFTYYDRHKALNQGYLYLEIEGAITSDLENYVALLDDAGFMGQWYNDLISGDKTNTVIVTDDPYFIMYIKNDIETDNKVKMTILYDTYGASEYAE